MECQAAHPRGKEMAVHTACELLNYCGQVSLASAAAHRFLGRTGMGQVKVTRNEHKVEKVAWPSSVIRKMSFQNYDQQRRSRGSRRAVDHQGIPWSWRKSKVTEGAHGLHHRRMRETLLFHSKRKGLLGNHSFSMKAPQNSRQAETSYRDAQAAVWENQFRGRAASTVPHLQSLGNSNQQDSSELRAELLHAEVNSLHEDFWKTISYWIKQQGGEGMEGGEERGKERGRGRGENRG